LYKTRVYANLASILLLFPDLFASNTREAAPANFHTMRRPRSPEKWAVKRYQLCLVWTWGLARNKEHHWSERAAGGDGSCGNVKRRWWRPWHGGRARRHPLRDLSSSTSTAWFESHHKGAAAVNMTCRAFRPSSSLRCRGSCKVKSLPRGQRIPKIGHFVFPYLLIFLLGHTFWKIYSHFLMYLILLLLIASKKRNTTNTWTNN
jgi:hypothetical protein